MNRDEITQLTVIAAPPVRSPVPASVSLSSLVMLKISLQPAAKTDVLATVSAPWRRECTSASAYKDGLAQIAASHWK